MRSWVREKIKKIRKNNRFGHWVVQSEKPFCDKKGERIMVRCICDCGTVRDMHAELLITGISKSCGCSEE